MDAKEIYNQVSEEYYREKANSNVQPRKDFLIGSRCLSDDEEIKERFAERIAKMLGLEYFQQSSIASTNEELSKLEKARELISEIMDVEDIEDEIYHSYYRKKFVFYSEDD